MAKILKNQTNPAANIEVSETGVTLLASSQYIIDPINYLYWATPETITELTPHINSGDIVINDGTNDLTPAQGIRFLEYTERLNINLNGTSITKVTKNINLIGSLAATDTGNGSIEISGNNTGVSEGRTFSINFYNNGNTANKWLFHIPTNEATNQLPYHNYFDVEIYGISFSNKNENIDCDIEIYVNGVTNPYKVYTIEIRNKKNYHITTLSSLFSMVVGDDLSVYIKKVGQSTPASVEVDMQLRITSNNIGAGGQ